MPALWNRLTNALQEPQVLGRQGGARTELWKKFHALTGFPAPGENRNESPEVLSDAPGSPLQAFTPLAKYTLPALDRARRGLMMKSGKFSVLDPGTSESHMSAFKGLFGGSASEAEELLRAQLQEGTIARFGSESLEASPDFLLSLQGKDLVLSRAQRALQGETRVQIDVTGKGRNLLGSFRLDPDDLIAAGGDLSRIKNRTVLDALRGSPRPQDQGFYTSMQHLGW